VEGDAGDADLGGFVGAIFTVTDYGVAESCELDADLILQSCRQCDSSQSCPQQEFFDRVSQLGACGVAVALAAQLLMHAFFSKIVDESCLLGGEMSANHGQVLADRSMREKLLDQPVPVARSLGKEKNSGGEAVDAMDDQRALTARLQVLRDERHGGRRVGAGDGDGEKSSRLVDHDHRIIFVEDGQLAGEARRAAGRWPGAGFVGAFLHGRPSLSRHR